MISFFLEGVVSEEGISTDPDKIKTVQDWPRPKTPKQMRGPHSGSLFSSVFLS
jgi:hypothetical protein